MKLLLRNSALTLAILLTVFLAAVKFRSVLGPKLTLPSMPAVLAVRVQMRGAMVTVAKLDSKPDRPAKVRGQRLRDKGEAMGGGTPDRVDKSTDTLAAQ